MHHPIAIFGEAAAQLLPKIRELNYETNEDALFDLAEVFLSDLCQQLVRAHKGLGRPPSDDDKVMLILMFTEHGIHRKTAESLYEEVIILGLEAPSQSETPHH